MMKTTALLVVFTLFVILYQTSAVPVASSYKLENENVMDVMEAKEKSEEASDDEKAKEDDEEADKEEEKSDEDKKEDDVKNEDEEEKEDEEKKDDEDKKDDEENKEDEDNKEDKEEKEEDKEEEPDLNEQENDQESSGEENVDLDSDHLVLQGSGNGKIKGVVIEDSDKEKDKPEKRSVDDDKKPSKSTQVQEKRCGCCGSWGEPGESCGCGNCCGGFECPHTCGSCGCGCCPQLNFPVTFGACVNNPCCECCQKKPPKGKCQWPCMWPCCCECDPPKFKFTPLKPKPMCHCPHHHGCCGGKKSAGPLKRSDVEKRCGFGCGDGFGYGFGYGHGLGYGYGLGPYGFGGYGPFGGFGPYGYGPFGGYGGYGHGFGPYPFY